MNLNCDEIDALTVEARYRYQERANIFKQIEIARKMHEIKTNKAVEEQGFSVKSFMTQAREFENYFDITTRYCNFKYMLELNFDLTTGEKNMIVDLHNTMKGTNLMYEEL